MEIRILKNTVMGLKEGDVRNDLPDALVKHLIRQGLAESVSGEVKTIKKKKK